MVVVVVVVCVCVCVCVCMCVFMCACELSCHWAHPRIKTKFSLYCNKFTVRTRVAVLIQLVMTKSRYK